MIILFVQSHTMSASADHEKTKAWMLTIQEEGCIVLDTDTPADLAILPLLGLSPTRNPTQIHTHLANMISTLHEGLSTIHGVVGKECVHATPVHPSLVDTKNALLIDVDAQTVTFSSPHFSGDPTTVSFWDLTVSSSSEEPHNNPWLRKEGASLLTTPNNDSPVFLNQTGAAIGLTLGLLDPVYGTPQSLLFFNHIRLAALLGAHDLFTCPHVAQHYHWGCDALREANSHAKTPIPLLANRGGIKNDRAWMPTAYIKGHRFDMLMKAAKETPRFAKAFALGTALSETISSLSKNDCDFISHHFLTEKGEDTVQFGEFTPTVPSSNHERCALLATLNTLMSQH